MLTQNLTALWPGANMTATYQWDNEGRMTSVAYPSYAWSGWTPPAAPTYGFQYDNVGRLNGMVLDPNGTPSTVATATYGAAGEMQSLAYLGVTQNMTYNSLLQLTHLTAGSLMDMTYNYSSTQNNGRITSSVDAVTGETVSYGYDSLNRLVTASAGALWGEAYTYDGFGNLTAKTPTQTPAPSGAWSYDAANRQIGLSYDADGNQLTDAAGTTGYTWDVENRLAGALTSSAGVTTAQWWYSYDPSGKRVMKRGWIVGNRPDSAFGGSKQLTKLLVDNCFPVLALDGHLGSLYK